jgi:hypothetical protein
MIVDHEARRSCCLHRRGFLAASAALGAALLLPGAARSAGVRLLDGNVTVNGKPATRATRVRAGDLIETGQDAKLVFVVGQDAFLLRERSSLKLETPTSGKAATTTIRLETGALVAVFGKGRRLIETATATATIRGTGVYIEASAEQTYFCTCYGEVELRDKTGAERKLVIAGYHTPNIIYARAVDGRVFTPAAMRDHTDVELIMLDGLVGRTSPLAGRRQDQESKAKSAQPDAPGLETSDAATVKQSKGQSKRRSKQPPSATTEPEPKPLTTQPAEPVPDAAVQPLPKLSPTPPAPEPEPELRLPPARLE